MTVLSILTYPNPLLRQRSSEVLEFDENLEKLIQDLFETLDQDQHGVGLAAPQVGVLQRIFVLHFQGRKLAVINPEFLEKTGTEYSEEGCLSCPGFCVDVARAERVVVRAKTVKGEDVTYKESGFIARILQHETDHLDGKLILDYVQSQGDQTDGPPIQCKNTY